MKLSPAQIKHLRSQALTVLRGFAILLPLNRTFDSLVRKGLIDRELDGIELLTKAGWKEIYPILVDEETLNGDEKELLGYLKDGFKIKEISK